MDFSFDETENMIVENARKFIERELAPEAERLKGAMLSADELRLLLPRLKPFGFLGTLIPEEDGGSGLDFITAIRIYEELFRVFPGLAGTAFVNQVTGYSIYRDGTAQQKEKYLPGLLDGTLLGAQAATEPEVGSNPRAIKMRARGDGEDVILNGRKIWISNGSVADFVVVLARTDDDQANRFIVDRDSGDFSSEEIPTLGQENWSTAELLFDQTRIPTSSQLGQAGTGTEQLLMDFTIARCFVSIAAVGIAQAAFDHAIVYAREREQWGKPIGKHQLVQEMVADMAVDLDCARLLALRAAYWVSRGQGRVAEAAMAKMVCTEAAVRVTSNAIQIHGAIGLSRDMPLEGLFRSARMMTIPDGTTQLQKLIIAREKLGMSAFA